MIMLNIHAFSTLYAVIFTLVYNCVNFAQSMYIVHVIVHNVHSIITFLQIVYTAQTFEHRVQCAQNFAHFSQNYVHCAQFVYI